MATPSDPLAAEHLKLREPDTALRYRLFLSSSDELAVWRDRIENLVEKSFNPRLDELADAYIRVVRWEQEMPQKAPQGEVNAMFVRRVLTSSLTIVLLRDELRPGTKEELKAALDKDDVQLSVIRFGPDRGKRRRRRDDIDAFLKPYRGKLLYEESGAMESEEAWQSLVKTLFGFALAAYETGRRRKGYGEVR